MRRILGVFGALLLLLVLLPSSVATGTIGPITITYPDITLPAVFANYAMPDVWDLNAGPVTVSYTLDLVGAPNVAYDWNWNNMGIVGMFSGGSGVRMCGFLSDGDNSGTKFPVYPDKPGTQDLDDKFNMQRFPNPGSYDEQMYDVNFATSPPTFGLPEFNPWANYGIWFDRDGVDQWQANGWGMVNGGTYNTNGAYDVQLNFSKFSVSKGVVSARFFPNLANTWDPTSFGIGTGFYKVWKATGPDYYPTGISFDTDESKMGSMKVYVQGASDEGTIIVKNLTVTGWLANRAPALSIDEPASGSLYRVDAPVTIEASFSDADGDTHTASIDWGDGTITEGTVTESNGTGTVTGSRPYTSAGVNTVQVTVIDEHGASDTESVMVVVYDPSAGFVTGGGWINSPAGAYVADPTLTGKATFGFVSKYQKGANVPTGNTEFQFKAGDLNFKSTSYDWLVVAGARAQYKGVGTINGAGVYGFMLTAIDGQVNGGGGVDKFRIKIWDKTTDTPVYDNMLGQADTAEPSTALGGGSIVIHTK